MEGVGSIADMLTTDNMEDTVVPFETDEPDEASLSPSEFEDRMFEIRAGDSDASRAYGATVDSALTRPEVDLGDDPLALADDAVEASDAVVAGLFEGQSCEATFDGQTYRATRQCTRDLSQVYRSCSEIRQVSVDRTDTWSCIKEEEVQTRVCERAVSWSCRGLQGAGCVRRALTISGSPDWNAAHTSASLTLPAGEHTSCQLTSDTFTIQAKDWITFSDLAIARLSFNGAAQIVVDGDVIWTYGTSTTGRLEVGTRNCGKRCTREAAYAGRTWIEDCSATARDQTMSADLSAAFASLTLGPSYERSTYLGVSTGASDTITVEIRRVNTREDAPTLRIEQQSSCCSAFRAQTGAQC